jgi:hypothetical protein
MKVLGMSGRFIVCILLQCLLWLCCVTAKSATGDRILVIHEDTDIESTFSQFFGSLTGSLVRFTETNLRAKLQIDVSQSKE